MMGDSHFQTSIKRSDDSSIDNLFGYSASDVENENQIEVDGNSLSPVIHEYQRLLDSRELSTPKLNHKFILTPDEIDSFLQLQEIFLDHEYNIRHFGKYVSSLIQNSYDAGYNGFEFNLENVEEFPYLGCHIKGNDKNLIKIKIVGDVGCGFGTEAKEVDVNIQGNVDYFFGLSSNNLIATINGDVAHGYGISSINMTTFIKGNSKKTFGNSSENMTAIIVGRMADYVGINSNNLTLAVDGSAGIEFGRESINLTAYIRNTFYLRPSDFKNGNIIGGNDAINHPEYIRMMKEFDEKMKAV
jgi:hypothetical protein